MSHLLLRKLISETITENKKTQSRRLQALTNAITSDLMSLIHSRSTKMASAPIGREDYFSFDPKTATAEFYELNAGPMPLSMDWESYENSDLEDTTLFVTLEIDRAAEELNVSGEDKDPLGAGRLGFTVTAEIPATASNQDYKIIRDQVANSVRHEIEHITQGKNSDQDFLAFGRGGEYYNFLHSPEEVKSEYAKYLLKPEEIPAFVRGEVHNSKNIEQLKSNIEDFLNGYIDLNLIQKKEKPIILNTWLDWASRHISRKGF
jgi:hypothetical protein